MIPVFLSLAAMIVGLAAAKTILFLKNIGDRKFIYWFYFPRYNVIPSSRISRKCKELQNKLSTILFFLILAELIVWIAMKIFY